MRIVFVGSGEFGVPTLEWLANSRHDISLIITQPAKPAGRGRKLMPTPVARRAADLQIPCVETPNINDPHIVAEIRNASPQILVVIAFGQKIGPDLLQLPNCRVLNLHGSLLPKYRGAAPINWAILNGETQTGITIFQIDHGWDTGAILARDETQIRPSDTAGELHDRLAAMGPELWAKVLDQIESNQAQPLPQNNQLACKAPKLKKSDGAINWAQPAETIIKQIHGLCPWPGAYCAIEYAHGSHRERLTLAHAEIEHHPSPPPGVKPHHDPHHDSQPIPPRQETLTPGTLTDNLTVACGTGRIKLLELKPQNGSLMSFADFVNGRHLRPGDRLLNGEITAD